MTLHESWISITLIGIWIKFHFNNWIKIQLAWIQIQLKKIQIVDKIVKFVCENGIGIFIKKQKYEKTSFYAFSLVNGPYIFQIEIW
jgi:hypothetical protein